MKILWIPLVLFLAVVLLVDAEDALLPMKKTTMARFGHHHPRLPRTARVSPPKSSMAGGFASLEEIALHRRLASASLRERLHAEEA